jgi:hypothetical protein
MDGSWDSMSGGCSAVQESGGARKFHAAARAMRAPYDSAMRDRARDPRRHGPCMRAWFAGSMQIGIFHYVFVACAATIGM